MYNCSKYNLTLHAHNMCIYIYIYLYLYMGCSQKVYSTEGDPL